MTTSNSIINNNRAKRAISLALIAQLLLVSLFAIIIFIPLGIAFYGGFKRNAELVRDPFALPEVWQVANYTDVIVDESFWLMLFNSLVVMGATTIGVVSLGAMAAYAFARVKFPGREILYNFFTIGLLFPAAVAILPLYLTVRDANLIDTYWGMILPQVAFGLPGTIVLLRGFFAQIPREIEESAAIDGASILRSFWSITLPIMRPALASVAVLVMVASWNAFFWPLLVVNSAELFTLPLGIMQFSSQYGTDYGRVFAFISISMIPAIAFYLVAERHIVSGLTAGAIKG